MNHDRLPFGTSRLSRVLIAVGVLALASSLPVPGQPAPAVPLVQPASPGTPVLGLRYFRLEPAVPDTVFRLLVIPVQFPEDGVLGGGSEAEILEKLNGSDPGNLQGYYSRETVGRLHIVSTLAPLVVAPHTRSYYTVLGTQNAGYGLDPRAYPHNAQGLVEDVTRALADRIDFRLYDNTEDGIVDGLLLLHSGPVSTETSAGALPPDVLLAHSFTLPTPEARGGSLVFPYSVAATRDGIGVWAHEVGHLFGLPDLYVANGFCPGPGLGEWSLMATGANRNGGEDPTGLDAFSLQLLGIAPRFDDGGGVTLGAGTFVRATDPGEEQGPRYYLVQSRGAGDGPAGSTPTRVIYLVNEDAVDNRVCPEPDYSPLVRVASVICPGDTACSQIYYTTCPACPNVGFTFSGNHVRVTSGALPPVVLSRVQLEGPEIGPGGVEEQRVVVSLHNVDPDAPHTVSIDLTAVNPDSVCLVGPLSGQETVAAGATTVAETHLMRCAGTGSLPRGDLTVTLRITEIGTTWSHEDTLVLPANHVGLDVPNFCGYASRSLDPERPNPWRARIVCPPQCGCPRVVTALIGSFSHGELVSPWFTVPRSGQLMLAHQWDLSALSPDVALDAGQVRLRRPIGDDVILEPPLGWGYTVERGVGNALGGQSALAGSGFRTHVLDLSAYSGDVVQIVLVAAGDAVSNQGGWNLSPPTVSPAPEITFSLEADPANPGTLVATTASPPQTGIQLLLYRGVPGTAPTDTAFNGSWNGDTRMSLGHFEGPKSRFELVWTDSIHAASIGRIFDLPVPSEPHFLLAPSPNPVHHGDGQDWSIRVPDGGPPGTYVLRLFSLDGGVRLERSVRIDLPGTRLIPWDGRDREGRTISSGIYFLEARRPDGVSNGQRVVVLP